MSSWWWLASWVGEYTQNRQVMCFISKKHIGKKHTHQKYGGTYPTYTQHTSKIYPNPHWCLKPSACPSHQSQLIPIILALDHTLNLREHGWKFQTSVGSLSFQLGTKRAQIPCSHDHLICWGWSSHHFFGKSLYQLSRRIWLANYLSTQQSPWSDFFEDFTP